MCCCCCLRVSGKDDEKEIDYDNMYMSLKKFSISFIEKVFLSNSVFLSIRYALLRSSVWCSNVFVPK